MKTCSSAPRVWLNPAASWELLDQLDISQNQLARLAGISPGHLSLLMNGKRSPAPKVRRRLMKALGVDDFRVLFVIERPVATGESAERANTPKRKKGGTHLEGLSPARAGARGYGSTVTEPDSRRRIEVAGRPKRRQANTKAEQSARAKVIRDRHLKEAKQEVA